MVQIAHKKLHQDPNIWHGLLLKLVNKFLSKGYESAETEFDVRYFERIV